MYLSLSLVVACYLTRPLPALCKTGLTGWVGWQAERQANWADMCFILGGLFFSFTGQCEMAAPRPERKNKTTSRYDPFEVATQ